jgi:hypothetical protein
LVKTAVNVAFLTFYKFNHDVSTKNAYLSLQNDKNEFDNVSHVSHFRLMGYLYLAIGILGGLIVFLLH